MRKIKFLSMFVVLALLLSVIPGVALAQSRVIPKRVQSCFSRLASNCLSKY